MRITYSADSQEEVQSLWFPDWMTKFPVEQMFPGKHQQAQAHGYQQHVENSSHVVNVQLTAHDLFLFITADAREPDSLQLLCVTCRWGGRNKGLIPICITPVLSRLQTSNEHPMKCIWEGWWNSLRLTKLVQLFCSWLSYFKILLTQQLLFQQNKLLGASGLFNLCFSSFFFLFFVSSPKQKSFLSKSKDFSADVRTNLSAWHYVFHIIIIPLTKSCIFCWRWPGFEA